MQNFPNLDKKHAWCRYPFRKDNESNASLKYLEWQGSLYKAKMDLLVLTVSPVTLVRLQGHGEFVERNFLSFHNGGWSSSQWKEWNFLYHIHMSSLAAVIWSFLHSRVSEGTRRKLSLGRDSSYPHETMRHKKYHAVVGSSSSGFGDSWQSPSTINLLTSLTIGY